MDKQLKPCPFCGNKDITIQPLRVKPDMFLDFYHLQADIICLQCATLKKVIVTGKDEQALIDMAIEVWNRRAENG